jgi:hypothetical protein
MSRMSAEARGASAFRAGNRPPPPPENFSDAAAAIWREIVGSKPVDWFDGGSFGLLRQFCRTMAQAESVALQLAATETDEQKIDALERRIVAQRLEALERRLIALNTCCTTLATKLRISVQAKISTRSGMLTEKADKDADDALLGGRAIHRPERLQ